jgi:AcrR family transcriptional regulator
MVLLVTDTPSPPDPPAPPAPRRGGEAPPDRPPRRTPLNRERILSAAITILDREGLNGVTMRAVADELDTGGASLYAHFASKDALIEGILDRIFAETPLPERVDGRRWKAQTKEIVRAIRATLGAHRDVARASLGNVPTSPHALRISERLIAVLRAGGLSEQTTAFGIDLLALYATATAYEESLYIKDGLGPHDFERWKAEMTQYMASLPPDRFPNLVALAVPLTAGTIDGDERFSFGLDVIIAGLDAQPR